MHFSGEVRQALFVLVSVLTIGCGSAVNTNEPTDSLTNNSNSLTVPTDAPIHTEDVPPSGLQQLWSFTANNYAEASSVVYYNFGANLAAAEGNYLKFFAKNSNEVLNSSVVNGVYPSLAALANGKVVIRLIFKRTATPNEYIPQISKFVDGAEVWTKEFAALQGYNGFYGGRIFISKDGEQIVACWDAAPIPNAASKLVTLNKDGVQLYPTVTLNLTSGTRLAVLTDDNALVISKQNSLIVFNALTGAYIGAANSYEWLGMPSAVKLPSGKTIIAAGNIYGALEMFGMDGIAIPVHYGYVATLPQYYGEIAKLHADANGGLFVLYAGYSTQQSSSRLIRLYQLTPDPANGNHLLATQLGEKVYQSLNTTEFSDFFDSDVAANGDIIVTDSPLNLQNAAANHISEVTRFKRTATGYTLMPTLNVEGQVMKLDTSPDGGQIAMAIRRIGSIGALEVYTIDQPSLTVVGSHLANLSVLVRGGAHRRCALFRTTATTAAGVSNLYDPPITVNGVNGQLYLHTPSNLGAFMLDATGVGLFNLSAANSIADVGKTYLLQVLCAGVQGGNNQYLPGWTAYAPLA